MHIGYCNPWFQINACFCLPAVSGAYAVTTFIMYYECNGFHYPWIAILVIVVQPPSLVEHPWLLNCINHRITCKIAGHLCVCMLVPRFITESGCMANMVLSISLSGSCPGGDSNGGTSDSLHTARYWELWQHSGSETFITRFSDCNQLSLKSRYHIT